MTDLTPQVEPRADALRRDGWVSLDQVQEAQVDFLWKPRIPHSALTLVAGDPGSGKSTFTLERAAEVSKRDRGVVILSVEDDPASVIKPRLRKFGARLDLIRVLPTDRAFALDEAGFEKAELALEEWRPELLIVDPITFFLGGNKDMHRANEVRSVLGRLSGLASKHRAAILTVAHMHKGASKLLYRPLGSIDFSAAARSVLAVAKLDDQPQQGRVIFHVKSNYGVLAEPIGFDIQTDPEDPEGSGLFRWLDQPGFRLVDFEGRSSSRAAPKRDFAEEFLTRFLANGARDASAAREAAESLQIARATLDRARKDLGVVTLQEYRPGHSGSRSTWSLQDGTSAA